jgi:predicted Na+-dependent transporter
LNGLIKFLNSQIIIIAVISGTIPALIFPEISVSLQKSGLTPWLIAGVFLCQGLGLNPNNKIKLSQNLKIISWSLITSFVIFPLIAFACLKASGISGDFFFGLMLISCMPCTLVSGIVISDLSGGDRRTALFITIALNCSAVLISPILIKIYLSSNASFDTIALIQKLAFTVFFPALLGWAIRKKLQDLNNKSLLSIKYLPVFLLGTVIFVNTGGQKEEILNSSLSIALQTAIISSVFHLICLYIFKWLGPKIKMTKEQSYSFAICCSQKTLPLTIAVWAASFSQTAPGALIAAMIYHLVQIYLDSTLCIKWRKV